ncbi:unnamed protein product [Rotaria magnacalcarata]|uniref:cAMP-regulated phosphoprotein 19 n=3 Tax=Rotaria magnacalcarata TaxID=392030 RepID=A0A816KL05_9BILA|nr:unnamed protein product [Rotaria magnacalcarata]CAF1205767.1 unnamed protein product [Rotaria magnacalcarata]CAF1928042.1 unnamed protein product [Rotaria magnacalcarata]CAF1956763.1 unnamed protein product [Rotaria magnacalcarata]CAF2140080.1 unnamed protein product [Rotaria magnacalcarata]
MASSAENTTPLNAGPTPEMSEEAKLRAKYGGALPRQQNMLTKKLMNKPKYFDSGDYNVAKAQGKLASSKPDPTNRTTSIKEATQTIVPETITGHEIPTPETVMPRKLSCAATMTPISTPTIASSSMPPPSTQ